MGKKNRGKVRNIGLENSEHCDGISAQKISDILDKYTSDILGESLPPKVKNESKLKNDILEVPKLEQKPPKQVEVVVFHSRRQKTTKNEKQSAPSSGQDTDSLAGTELKNQRLNSSEMLEKLKFDVGSFGLKAFSKEEQRRRERMRAIKLGAIAPKRKHVNYKVFMEERKQGKEDEELNSKKSKTSVKGEKKLKQPVFWKEGNKSFTPQIGKYKDGVLKISTKDIKSITRRR